MFILTLPSLATFRGFLANIYPNRLVASKIRSQTHGIGLVLEFQKYLTCNAFLCP
ncbi:MAG: hypothetical protein IBX45_06835 [Campylobacterales bacterium]|nr:hypothetical protein [Campylobacterales bacterium]